MTVYRMCPRGHGPFDRALGRCPACPPSRHAGKARAAQRRFQRTLVAMSDGRCAFVDPDGIRCAATEQLEAAHLGDSYASTGTFTAGAMLCPTHHRLVDRAVLR